MPVLIRVQLLVLVPGDASTDGPGIFHQLADKGWAFEGDTKRKFDQWQLTRMPDDAKLSPEAGYEDFTFTMIKDKNIDPRRPNQWKPEPEYQRRLDPPSHALGAWTNLSNKREQCLSSHAHVVGVAFTYHDYVTHNSYYKKKHKQPEKENLPRLE